MSRPTMDRAIEALDRGDVDAARALCEEMKHEWRYLHDLMVEGIGGLISFVQDRLGDDGVADAWTSGQGRGWRRDVEAIAAARSPADRAGAGGDVARALLQRHRSASGSVHDRRGRREVHVRDEPLWLRSASGANGTLRGSERARQDPIRARLELRARGVSAVLHALLVHERVTPDPMDRLSAVSERSSGRLRPRSVHVVLVQGSGRHPRPALGAPRADAQTAMPASTSPAGRRVVVTGAAGGIGRAMVDALAQSGCAVAACDVAGAPLGGDRRRVCHGSVRRPRLRRRAGRRRRRDRGPRRLRCGGRKRGDRRHDPPRRAILRRRVAQGHRDESAWRVLSRAGGVRGAGGVG